MPQMRSNFFNTFSIENSLNSIVTLFRMIKEITLTEAIDNISAKKLHCLRCYENDSICGLQVIITRHAVKMQNDCSLAL